MTDYLGLMTHGMSLLAGAFIGVVVVALCTMARPIDPLDVEDDPDTELLDFLFRNDLSLLTIQQNGGSVMWGVSQGMRRIGDLAFDPRTAVENAMLAMEDEVVGHG